VTWAARAARSLPRLIRAPGTKLPWRTDPSCPARENNRDAPLLIEIETMNRGNLVYLAIGALVVIASMLGYQLYQDRKQPEGVQILVGPNGVSIDKK
jgi:hypothetical protein